jgi:hypothetical protein
MEAFFSKHDVFSRKDFIMAKSRFVLPVEPLAALGIIGVVWFGMQVGIGAYQRFENWGKVLLNITVAQTMECR